MVKFNLLICLVYVAPAEAIRSGLFYNKKPHGPRHRVELSILTQDRKPGSPRHDTIGISAYLRGKEYRSSNKNPVKKLVNVFKFYPINRLAWLLAQGKDEKYE